MEDKHPIDKLFKDGLQAPETPFDPRDWEKLSQKMRHRKMRRIPVLVWIASGVAAALVFAAILLLNNRQVSVENTNEYAAGQVQPDSARTSGKSDETDRDIPASTEANGAEKKTVASNEPIDRSTAKEKTVDTAATYPRELTGELAALPKQVLSPSSGNQISTVARVTPPAITSRAAANSPQPRSGSVPRKGWAFSVIAAPDWSGAQPLSGKLSSNIGLLATYRVNDWLSLSGGALYARKIYQADFSYYRPDRWRSNGSTTPGFVNADCTVLDIPMLANATIKRFRRSDFFVSAGISSYFMLRETYDYRYPPEAGREPWELTIRNQNRHLLGVGNLSVGYRRQLTPSVSLAVQPFVKAPLTGIGNGNIKLYSTGVAISADIDLTRRDR